ncbi:MAG: SEC-C domain-containing protein [Rhodospirillum sp.]|nr:SEC-C domain-containing protein [Rhodospirillum sp.]MCF8501774.1 SEC-C domain-containing protein [Rhodospirillum sp.]
MTTPSSAIPSRNCLPGTASPINTRRIRKSVVTSPEGKNGCPGSAHTNPLRGFGRNDPCPCGSGKKFKKCCMP